MELKQPTTFDEQLKKLKERGCLIENEDACLEVLSRVNYYRFTAYFLTFKMPNDCYRDGTTFQKVYRIYEFDRKLRTLIISALEEIEIYLRTQFSYYHAHKYGADGYLDEGNYNNKHNHKLFLSMATDEIKRNEKSLVVRHHNAKYSGKFPIWVVTEFFTFGMLSYFYSDLISQDRKFLAASLFNTSEKNLHSWLRCCTDLRNICAHYGRLYNRVFSAIPATPIGLSIILNNRRLFDNIMVVKFLYPSTNEWNAGFLKNIQGLILEYHNDMELRHIGFPNNWYELLTK